MGVAGSQVSLGLSLSLTVDYDHGLPFSCKVGMVNIELIIDLIPPGDIVNWAVMA